MKCLAYLNPPGAVEPKTYTFAEARLARGVYALHGDTLFAKDTYVIFIGAQSSPLFVENVGSAEVYIGDKNYFESANFVGWFVKATSQVNLSFEN